MIIRAIIYSWTELNGVTKTMIGNAEKRREDENQVGLDRFYNQW